MLKEPAIVLANHLFDTPNGKTAHGLVRGSGRFKVVAIVDPDVAGRDAGEVLDGRPAGIPVVADLDEAMVLEGPAPKWCIVGVATHGGRLLPELHTLILDAVDKGLGIVNGLHDTTADDAEVAAAARGRGVELIDLRRSKPRPALHFWEGDIYRVRAPRLAVLGTDCALGKRTTTRLIVEAMNRVGVRTEMIYTGQTGWMQGARHGIVLDSIVNDFVCGELEHAIVGCDRDVKPDLMVIEGQSSLRNPSGPCGAELLLSAAARGVVLQHAPGREFFEGYESMGLRIPSLESEIDLIRLYGAETIAVTLNSKGCPPDELDRFRAEYRTTLGIPVIAPLTEGAEALVPAIRAFVERERSAT
ncbi:MAG: DUF1611 domain-containing protein [Thiotrichales bacterium]|nr:DUF1611 domain-containing protein [Thiotrichales bacterium]